MPSTHWRVRAALVLLSCVAADGATAQERDTLELPPSFRQPMRLYTAGLGPYSWRVTSRSLGPPMRSGSTARSGRTHPHNGWSLYGLEQSLRAQHTTAGADRVRREFLTAWGRSETLLRSSRL